jgi:hypothetical protein
LGVVIRKFLAWLIDSKELLPLKRYFYSLGRCVRFYYLKGLLKGRLPDP